MDDAERTLAVLLRQTEWLISDLAHHFPAGRVSSDKRNDAADVLEDVARLLRVEVPIVIDATGTNPEHTDDR